MTSLRSSSLSDKCLLSTNNTKPKLLYEELDIIKLGAKIRNVDNLSALTWLLTFLLSVPCRLRSAFQEQLLAVACPRKSLSFSKPWRLQMLLAVSSICSNVVVAPHPHCSPEIKAQCHHSDLQNRRSAFR